MLSKPPKCIIPNHNNHNNLRSIPKTIIIICGSTAVGKTALAIQLAQSLQTQIISADSRQCFQELNIGVAKPSEDELTAVSHHFINSHSIHDLVDAGVYEAYALAAAEKIFETNDVAVMVGGTGLYIRAFCEGMDDIPAIDVNIRKQIAADYELHGLEWLQQQVAEHDPAFWQLAEQQNPQRLMRGLEVILSTGKSIVHFQKGAKKQRPFHIIKTGIELPRETMYKRINNRVDVMVENGLIEEVKNLLPYQQINALQTVGYKELFEYFNGNISLEKALENIKTNTRHYAKRQMTWFKKDPEINWFAPSAFHSEILRLLKNR